MWRKQRGLDVRGLAKQGSTEETLQSCLSCKDLAGLTPVTRSQAEERQAGKASTSGRDWQAQIPLDLRIGCVKGGAPDLQFRVFTCSSGCLQPQTPQSQGLVGFCQTSAALLFLRVIFPDQFTDLQRPLLGVGLTVVTTKLAAKGWHAASSSSQESTWPFRSRRLAFRRRPKLQEGNTAPSLGRSRVARSVGSVANKACDLAKPAAALAVIALLWRQVHPTSYQLGQAILVAVNLSAGYNETKRQAATGRIASGPQLEAAWRSRHKWAAQRASKVMVDVYDSPPLRPFMTAAQKISIGFLMLMHSGPAGSLESPTGVGFARGTSAESQQATLLASFPGGRRRGPAVEEKEGREVGPVTASPTKSFENLPLVPPVPNRPDQEGGSADFGTYEPFESFKPSQQEDLSTGDFPTITCFEDLLQYKQNLANMGRHSLASDSSDDSTHRPINVAANATGSKPVQPPGKPPQIPDDVVLFTTEELKAMDPGMRQGIDYSEESETGPKLALYGRADHTPKPPLTVLEKQWMVIRATFLVMFFLPFIMLGPLLLAFSNRFERKPAPKPAPKPQASRAPQIGDILEDAEAKSEKPVVVHSKIRTAAWQLLLWGIRNGGAAFIKWGQWSSTREDMFPVEFCTILAELHDAAPTHTWEESKVEIERSFGKLVEDLFESIEHEPLASGSIAQVHKAIMIIGGKRRSVVVKVRHPGVETRIRQDFEILKPLAHAASKFKSLKGLSLKESLAQFSSTMTAQTDLRVEAAHLIRFFRNFAPVRGSVTPPFPLPDYISEGALIETFEPGQSVAKYIKNPAPFNTQVVALGVDTYLKMLLEDNFVHTDLHPGNILVRRGDGGELNRDVAADEVRGKLQLILLDFGLAEELNPTVRKHFISFLHMIAAGNGRRAAEHILQWSQNQSCPDPAGFTEAMIAMFKVEAQIQTVDGIELDKVMKAVLQIARQYEVSIDSSYAALVIGVVVLVGFATSMDPGVNLMDAAAPAFLQNNLLGKVSGRLYS